MPDTTSSYAGTPGGPRDPQTPGGYCLARCLCGTCPQYARQAEQTVVLREQEYQKRLRLEGERAARLEKHRGHLGRRDPGAAA